MTIPPASSTSSIPAAVSHDFRPNSQNASKRPHATEQRSSAAEPSRRTPCGSQRETRVVSDVRVLAALIGRKSRDDQARSQRVDRRNVNRLVVEVRAFAARRREQFSAHWIKNNADNRLAIFEQSNRDGKARIAVREIRGAVERIDVPAISRFPPWARRFPLRRRFRAAENSVAICRPQLLRSGDQIPSRYPLRPCKKFSLADRIPPQQRTCFARRVNRDFEKLVHYRGIAEVKYSLR